LVLRTNNDCRFRSVTTTIAVRSSVDNVLTNEAIVPLVTRERTTIMSPSLSVSELQRAIESQLRPEEKLIWVGQRDPAQFPREVARACLLQLALFALFIPVSVWIIFHISQSWIPSILLVGGMIGYLLIAAPWRYPNRVLQTIYAITEQRALVYQGFGWSLLWLQALPDLYNTLWSFDPRQIRARRRIRRYEGRTDLVFTGERRYHMTGRGQIPDWVQVGFLGLRNVDQVDQLLESHFAHVDAEWV
jgi:hypothetical protein